METNRAVIRTQNSAHPVDDDDNQTVLSKQIKDFMPSTNDTLSAKDYITKDGREKGILESIKTCKNVEFV